MNENEVKKLETISRELRYVITDMICRAGSGHIGGALSLVDILVVLYFKIMNVKPQEPRWEDRDRFILSKGHAGPVLYATLAYKGYFPKEWLATMNKNGTYLPSHVDQQRTPGVDQTAGSLGQGISCAVGLALSAKISKKSHYVYCIVGDGESQEGQVWEAAMFAGHNKLDNLIAFTDFNRMQIDGTVEDVNTLEPVADKWRSFGWDVIEIDGHNLTAIDDAIKKAQSSKGKPTMIVARTIKAKGNVCVEGQVGSHNIKVSNDADYKKYVDGTDHEGLTLPY
ncbi:MAG TPA: transketolase [Spirochaetota bacterium]